VIATEPTSVPRAAQARPAAAPRRDIQGLRTLAVTLVVLLHFWPGRLLGGYVGVDVSFVIAGFLITSHLLTKPPLHWRDLGRFGGSPCATPPPGREPRPAGQSRAMSLLSASIDVGTAAPLQSATADSTLRVNGRHWMNDVHNGW
jgi:hypothetical protein